MYLTASPAATRIGRNVKAIATVRIQEIVNQGKVAVMRIDPALGEYRTHLHYHTDCTPICAR